MKKVAVAKFKEQCLSLLEQLDRDGLVITKHGKPVARVLPIERAPADLIGSLRTRIRVKGDILSTGAHGARGTGQRRRKTGSGSRSVTGPF